MRFKEYLKEKTMPVHQALAVFGLNRKALGNKALIKKRYRDLAKTYHPDKIGSNDMMKDINLAYEILKKSKSTSLGEFPDYEHLKGKAKSNLMKDLGSMFNQYY